MWILLADVSSETRSQFVTSEVCSYDMRAQIYDTCLSLFSTVSLPLISCQEHLSANARGLEFESWHKIIPAYADSSSIVTICPDQ